MDPMWHIGYNGIKLLSLRTDIEKISLSFENKNLKYI